MKKLLLVLFLLLGVFFPEISASNESNIYDVSYQIANHFLESLKMNDSTASDYSDMSILSGKVLLDANDIENGAIFFIENEMTTGHITVYNVDGILNVTEFSNESDLSAINKTDAIYYFGILDYYERVSFNKYKNIFTNVYIEKEMESSKIDINASLAMIKARTYWHEDGYYGLTNNLPFVTQQPKKTACASASAAMVLEYWKKYHDFDALPLTGTELRDELIGYLGTTKVSVKQAFDGINNYVKSLNDNYFISGNKYSSWSGEGLPLLQDSHLDKIITQIAEYDQPVIVTVGNKAYVDEGIVIGVNSDLLHNIVVDAVRLNSSGTSYLECYDPWFEKKTKVNIYWHPQNDDPDYFWIYGLITFAINGY